MPLTDAYCNTEQKSDRMYINRVDEQKINQGGERHIAWQPATEKKSQGVSPDLNRKVFAGIPVIFGPIAWVALST